MIYILEGRLIETFYNIFINNPLYRLELITSKNNSTYRLIIEKVSLETKKF